MQNGCQRQRDDGATHRVLVVDDDELVGGLTADYLEHVDERFRATTVTEQAAALAHVRAGDVDCLVTDYHMPGRSGLELCEDVRQIDPGVPCVVFTSDDRDDLARRSEAAGVGLVLKARGSSQFDVLASEVRTAIESAGDDTSDGPTGARTDEPRRY